ncbi:MAG: transposase [Xanthomonadales bacterium]|nr:transposase [Xanthomonadales bacterium]
MPNPAPHLKTPALELLRETYDTTRLLQRVDSLDEVRHSVDDPGGLRNDLLRLHAMAHTLINGGPLSVASSPTMLGDLAMEISMEVERLVALLEEIRRGVEPLETLASEDETSGSSTGAAHEEPRDPTGSRRVGQ